MQFESEKKLAIKSSHYLDSFMTISNQLPIMRQNIRQDHEQKYQ